MSKVRTAVVIPAAGHGKRMNMDISKQYIEINEKPLLAYTISVFQRCAVINDIILVVGKDEIGYVTKYIKEQYGFDKITAIVAGGVERQDSVYKGLLALDSNIDYVMVHDGARPFVTNEDIELILEETMMYKACVLGVNVKDTIKEVDQNGNVVNTPDRDTLYQIQTPQCFEKGLLLDAYGKGIKRQYKATDDSMMVEQYSDTSVKVVEGSYNNIKITNADDLELMRHRINTV